MAGAAPEAGAREVLTPPLAAKPAWVGDAACGHPSATDVATKGVAQVDCPEKRPSPAPDERRPSVPSGAGAAPMLVAPAAAALARAGRMIDRRHSGCLPVPTARVQAVAPAAAALASSLRQAREAGACGGRPRASSAVGPVLRRSSSAAALEVRHGRSPSWADGRRESAQLVSPAAAALCSAISKEAPAPPATPAPLGGSRLQERRRKTMSALKLNTSLAVAEARVCAGNDQSRGPQLSDRYDVLEAISQGTVGVVHRALRREDGRQVALKVVRSSDEEMVLIQRKEYEVLRSIDHPHIVRAFDFFTTVDRIVLVLDFFDGAELASAVPRASGGRLTEASSQRLFLALAQAVEYLHRRRIVHRDVKPQNILVSSDLADLKLVDFNTARRMEDGGCLTMTGTHLYAAPEVLLGESPGEESDVWSMGLCLHFTVSGFLPQGRGLLAKADLAQLRARCAVPPSFQGHLWDNLSAECKTVLEQCLAVSPLARPTAPMVLRAQWLRGADAGGAQPHLGRRSCRESPAGR